MHQSLMRVFRTEPAYIFVSSGFNERWLSTSRSPPSDATRQVTAKGKNQIKYEISRPGLKTIFNLFDARALYYKRV